MGFIDNITPISYVAVSLLFILALTGLSAQKKAKAGNVFGILGMIFALVATFLHPEFQGKITFWIWMAPGALIGCILAAKVAMTSMPELVACLHSFVGLAATLVGIAHMVGEEELLSTNSAQIMLDVETFLGVFIGGMTFTGSFVAFGKLRGFIRSKPLILGKHFRHVLNAVLILGCVVLMVLYAIFYKNTFLRWIFQFVNTAVSFFIGWHMVMAIGGADMPVVVSMLNSYSGWATAMSGFMLGNDAMIVTGSLVGSSGAILSYIMCEAMNRGFISVILGGFGGESVVPAAPAGGADVPQEKREVHPFTAAETVDAMLGAKSIVIVPGYGLAVARGQHAIASITEILRSLGKNVRFAIHPVAGRLPGHMNVLLAEANVPYDIVLSMEEINDDMPETDVTIVVGANDIVNPIALTDPECAIAGMPIIETFKSGLCIVNKRGMASGYAGIDNPLFYYDNTRMLFGDAKKAFDEVLSILQSKKAEMKVDESAAVKGAVQEVAQKITADDLPPVFCTLGVPKEIDAQERMVAISPNVALNLRKKGFGIAVEAGAGERAKFRDSDYEEAFCQVVPRDKVYEIANVILKVQAPKIEAGEDGKTELSLLREGQILISYVYPGRKPELLKALIDAKVTSLAMDMVPRITRAQSLDALSSMANLAGYRAVVEAAHAFGRVFTGQITAAGKLPPANVLVIGCGVAGLAAVGTAKNLGAVVKAFDTRKSVIDQIVSMGGEYLPCDCDEDTEDERGYSKPLSKAYIEAEMALFHRVVPQMDIVITTAAIPNRAAPKLVLTEMVEKMKSGSVIVDLAAATGGNCELCQPGKTIVHNGVTIIGDTDLTARMAPQASNLYGQNINNLLDLMVDKKEKKFSVNLDDEIVRQMTITMDGRDDLYPPPVLAVTAAAKKPAAIAPPTESNTVKSKDVGFSAMDFVYIILIMALLVGMVFFVPDGFISHLMSFVLAVIVGYYVVWNVTPALHTPLMSETNAVSGIIAVGGMLCLQGLDSWTPKHILGGVATLLATINIFGGFYITARMLSMFHD